MACFVVGVLCMILLGCGLGDAVANNAYGDVISFLTREKCIDELGCFSATAPFFNILERPISLLPDDRDTINTKFSLYTPEYPNTPMNFSNMNSSLDNLHRSGFNPNINTKFVVPGFISNVAEHWKMVLKDALMFSERCNVFYVDWSGGDGPIYEQAVANTRVVGAEIALFIQNLEQRTGINPQTVHIIGHSLGSHIAGYAGKRTPNLGRITAMDPAGPYFINVDPVVRLDRADALFVDAIHTNAAPSRFQGFGLTQSIGHFDFFPNGGHIQPGCLELGTAILEFLKHPSFNLESIHDLMCSHARAIDLFISSILHNNYCEMTGVECDNWQDFSEGKCGNCVKDNAVCVPMGMHADHYSSQMYKHQSMNFYLNTTDSEPFCRR